MTNQQLLNRLQRQGSRLRTCLEENTELVQAVQTSIGRPANGATTTGQGRNGGARSAPRSRPRATAGAPSPWPT